MPAPRSPQLADVHVVLRFAFELLGEANNLDALLTTLQVASGVTHRESRRPPDEQPAASCSTR
jgi:hypothetical protein